MAEYGIEDSGDIAGVAGVGTGGNAQPLQSFPAGTAFPMGVLGVGGPEAGYGVCGLGYSPAPLPALAAPNDAVGVYGQGGAGNSIGVVGVGTGSSPGVVGTGGGANGTGVAGNGSLPTGIGVWGSGASHGETAQPPAGNPIGVFGAAGTGDADGVFGIGSGSRSGVVGIADPNSANGIGVRGGGGAVGVWGSGAGATATPPAGDAIGVFGAGGSGNSDGVYGIGHSNGYGGQFASGSAPLRLVPAAAGTGHPTGAQHNVGESYVDSHGSLSTVKQVEPPAPGLNWPNSE